MKNTRLLKQHGNNTYISIEPPGVKLSPTFFVIPAVRSLVGRPPRFCHHPNCFHCFLHIFHSEKICPP